MKQAKTLNQQEVRRVLDYVATRKHALRNRAMVLTTFLSGVRVGELAKLKIEDVVASDGTIKSEIHLGKERTKHQHARTVFINERLRKELASYIATLTIRSPQQPLFGTQKNRERGFSPNTAAQHFLTIYRGAGIDGASSHSGRRTFITSLANKGVGVRVLMSLAGHQSMSTTQSYIDVNAELMRKAVELA